MSHIETDRTLQSMVTNAQEMLRGHGYQIVTEDKMLFPYFTPSLAALKDGRLIVFSFSVFPNRGQFDREIDVIQSILQDSVETNAPASDARVKTIEKVAVVLAPESVEEMAPGGDIEWIGLGSPGELAERMRHRLTP